MNAQQTETSPLTRAPEQLRRIATTVVMMTHDRDLALTILDCADKLEKLIKLKEQHD